MKKTLFLLLAGLLMAQTSAQAAWMRGVVKDVDAKNRLVTFERANAEYQEAYPKEISIKILDNAKLKNIASLSELQRGQEIKLDARANKEQGRWDANYVELVDADADVNVGR